MRYVLVTLVLILGCGGTGVFDFDDDGFKGGIDCDDWDEEIRPDAGEKCDPDGVDEDCDDDVNDEDDDLVNPTTWHADEDGDGYGDPDRVRQACAAEDGEVERSSDCDDTRADINPGADEVCDDADVDEDCDDLADDDDDSVVDRPSWYVDLDGDGYGNPDSTELWCDAGNGVSTDGTDCDDTDDGVNPGEEERCDDADVDEDCDGLVDDDDDASDLNIWYVDNDHDGYGSEDDRTRSCDAGSNQVDEGGDCDDANSRVNPGAAETCSDGIDNDCDGVDDVCLI